MGGVCGRNGGEKKYKDCGEKTLRKEIFSMTEAYEGVEWTHLDQVRGKWQALVNTNKASRSVKWEDFINKLRKYYLLNI